MKERGKFNNIYGNGLLGYETTIGSFNDIGGLVGDYCTLESYISIPPGVVIGNNVFIGNGVLFCNDKHPKAHNSDFKLEGVLVKNGATIGSGSIIMAGVTIGENAVIGAGSLVLKDVPDCERQFGSPAKFNCPLGNEKCIQCGHC